MEETEKEKIDLRQNRSELRRQIKEVSKKSGQPFNELWVKFMNAIRENQKLKNKGDK